MSAEVTSFSCLQMLHEYLVLSKSMKPFESQLIRGRQVMVKKMSFKLKHFKSSELELIPDIVNDLKVEKLNVHHFGEFFLSISAFVINVMPGLTRLKSLSLNIHNTIVSS